MRPGNPHKSPLPGQRFDFYGANQSRYCTPVAVGWLGDLVIFLANVKVWLLGLPNKIGETLNWSPETALFLWCFLGIAMFFVGSQNEAQLQSSPRRSGIWLANWETGGTGKSLEHRRQYRPTNCHQDSTLFNSMVCSCIFPTYIAMIDMYLYTI